MNINPTALPTPPPPPPPPPLVSQHFFDFSKMLGMTFSKPSPVVNIPTNFMPKIPAFDGTKIL